MKNKVAAPFRNTEFDIMYNEGISLSGDVVDTGLIHGVITKTGNTLSFGQVKLGVGRENAKDLLKEKPELLNEIRAKIWEVVKSKAE